MTEQTSKPLAALEAAYAQAEAELYRFKNSAAVVINELVAECDALRAKLADTAKAKARP